jgi:hypothetical protein
MSFPQASNNKAEYEALLHGMKRGLLQYPKINMSHLFFLIGWPIWFSTPLPLLRSTSSKNHGVPWSSRKTVIWIQFQFVRGTWIYPVSCASASRRGSTQARHHAQAICSASIFIRFSRVSLSFVSHAAAMETVCLCGCRRSPHAICSVSIFIRYWFRL